MNGYKPSFTERATNTTIKGLTSVICRVDAAELAQVPAQGPLIVASNHINILEVPIIYTRLAPRPMTGFSKTESWDNPFLAWLFDLWGIIPIRRGEADKTALKKGLQALEQGFILTIAPEGTRSRDGRLQAGRPGIVMLALISGAPILPVVHYGHEDFKKDFRKLRRPEFYALVGRPFRLQKPEYKVTSEIRQKMVDEIMYQMAQLLPPAYRGVYADLSKATEEYLDFNNPFLS
jgi:1-acyl-sn-glycerol-3-phosphate acyltransferase